MYASSQYIIFSKEKLDWLLHHPQGFFSDSFKQKHIYTIIFEIQILLLPLITWKWLNAKKPSEAIGKFDAQKWKNWQSSCYAASAGLFQLPHTAVRARMAGDVLHYIVLGTYIHCTAMYYYSGLPSCSIELIRPCWENTKLVCLVSDSDGSGPTRYVVGTTRYYIV